MTESGSLTIKDRRENHRIHPGLMFVGPAVFVLVATAVFPLLYALAASLSQTSLIEQGMKFAGLTQYIRAFEDARFWQSLFTTLQIAIPSLILELSLGISIATLLNQKLSIFRITRPLIFLPMMITPVVVGLIWAVMYNPDFGIINYFLSLIGIKPILWLAHPVYSKIAIIITNVWEWTPFGVLVFLASLQGMPEEPFRAARVDGATNWQIFRRLTLPLMKPVILVVVLIRTIWLLQLFDIVMVITAGGPGSSTETLSMYIYKQGFHFFDLGYASALSLIYLIFISIVCTFIIRWLRVNR